mgnify:CR=1 FL=1
MIYISQEGGEIEVSPADANGAGVPLYFVSGALTWRDAYALAAILRRQDAPDADVRDVAAAEQAGLGWESCEDEDES